MFVQKYMQDIKCCKRAKCDEGKLNLMATKIHNASKKSEKWIMVKEKIK